MTVPLAEDGDHVAPRSTWIDSHPGHAQSLSNTDLQQGHSREWIRRHKPSPCFAARPEPGLPDEAEYPPRRSLHLCGPLVPQPRPLAACLAKASQLPRAKTSCDLPREFADFYCVCRGLGLVPCGSVTPPHMAQTLVLLPPHEQQQPASISINPVGGSSPAPLLPPLASPQSCMQHREALGGNQPSVAVPAAGLHAGSRGPSKHGLPSHRCRLSPPARQHRFTLATLPPPLPPGPLDTGCHGAIARIGTARSAGLFGSLSASPLFSAVSPLLSGPSGKGRC